MESTKCLADHLRQVSEANGVRLRASHAHELVAAFFGYNSKAALDANIDHFLSSIGQTFICIPNLEQMDARRSTLQELSPDLPSSRELAQHLMERLYDDEDFTGQICFRDELSDLEDYLTGDYLPDQAHRLGDLLSGVMAETNAIFDEEEYNSVVITESEDALVFRIDTTIRGDTLEDRVVCGDQIDAEITLTSHLIAGRSLYGEPEMKATGEINDDWYDPELRYG